MQLVKNDNSKVSKKKNGICKDMVWVHGNLDGTRRKLEVDIILRLSDEVGNEFMFRYNSDCWHWSGNDVHSNIHCQYIEKKIVNKQQELAPAAQKI